MNRFAAVGLASLCVGLLGVAAAPAVATKQGESPGVLRLHASDVDAAAPEPLTDSPVLKVLSKQPATFRFTERFASTDERFKVVIKRFEPMTIRLEDWPFDEAFFLVKGELEITDSSSVTQRYSPGDAFVFPRGFSGTARMLSEIEVITVEYTPPG